MTPPIEPRFNDGAIIEPMEAIRTSSGEVANSKTIKSSMKKKNGKSVATKRKALGK